MGFLKFSFILLHLCTIVFTVEDCQRNYTQRCDSCTAAHTCGSTVFNITAVTANDCQNICYQIPSCNLSEYDFETCSCSLYECTNMQISTPYRTAVFRKTCNTDCMTFTLTLNLEISKIIPLCKLPVLSGIETPLGCMAECFDSNDCRALILPTQNNDCKLCSAEQLLQIDALLKSSNSTTFTTTTLEAQYEVRLIRRFCETNADTTDLPPTKSTCAVFSPSTNTSYSGSTVLSDEKAPQFSSFSEEPSNIALLSTVGGISVIALMSLLAYLLF